MKKNRVVRIKPSDIVIKLNIKQVREQLEQEFNFTFNDYGIGYVVRQYDNNDNLFTHITFEMKAYENDIRAFVNVGGSVVKIKALITTQKQLDLFIVEIKNLITGSIRMEKGLMKNKTTILVPKQFSDITTVIEYVCRKYQYDNENLKWFYQNYLELEIGDVVELENHIEKVIKAYKREVSEKEIIEIINSPSINTFILATQKNRNEKKDKE